MLSHPGSRNQQFRLFRVFRLLNWRRCFRNVRCMLEQTPAYCIWPWLLGCRLSRYFGTIRVCEAGCRAAQSIVRSQLNALALVSNGHPASNSRHRFASKKSARRQWPRQSWKLWSRGLLTRLHQKIQMANRETEASRVPGWAPMTIISLLAVGLFVLRLAVPPNLLDQDQ